MSEYATTPPIDSRQLALINLEGQIQATRRRLADAGRSTKRGADLQNMLSQLEAELRDLAQPTPCAGVTGHDE
jgi:hypothetical protein